MFGGEDAGLSLGDLSGGARAFQPGHAAKFAQGPRGGGSDGAWGVPARPQPNIPATRVALLLPAGRAPPQRIAIASHQDARRRKRGHRALDAEAPTRDSNHTVYPLDTSGA